MRNLVLLFFLVWWFVPPQPPLEFWEDHPRSEKQLWLFIKDTLLDMQGIPINHEQKDENNQRACSKRKECPAGPRADFGSWRGSAVFAMPSATVPRVHLGLVVMPGPGGHSSTAGRDVPATPKPSWTALDPGNTIPVSKQSPSRIQARTRAPVPWAISLPLPPLCAQQGLCLCSSCIHTWLCWVPAGPTVVTDYRNYNSSKTQYFIIHIVCALKNQISNRLASILTFYKWQQPTAIEIDLKSLITQYLCSFVSHICKNATLWKSEFNTINTLQDHQLWILKKKCRCCTFSFLNKYYKIEFYWVSHKMHL